MACKEDHGMPGKVEGIRGRITGCQEALGVPGRTWDTGKNTESGKDEGCWDTWNSSLPAARD